MDATSLNIAIIPTEEVKKEAIQLSQKIATDFPVHFSLNETNFFPHITLYQAHFPNTNIKPLTDSLSLTLKDLPPLVIQLTIFELRFDTFLFWNCEKTKELQDLHEKIVSIANPFRNNLVLPHLASVTNISAEDQEDIVRFGSLLIGSRYYPHITITRLPNESDGKSILQKIENQKQVSFTVKNIIVGNLGLHGTVNKIINIFELTGN